MPKKTAPPPINKKTSSASLDALAAKIGIDRRTLTAWRSAMGAPRTLVHLDWIAWLTSSGRHDRAAALCEALGMSPPAKAANGSDDDNTDWRIEHAKEKTLYERLRRAKLEGSLIKRTEIDRIMNRAADILLGQIERGLWGRLAPELSSIPPESVAGLHKGMLRAQAEIRSEAAKELGELMAELEN